MRILFGILIILHGLIHVWYVVLSQGWIAFQEEMGWTGKSWLLTGALGKNLTLSLATVFYGLSAITFVVTGIGIISGQSWYRPWSITAASLSIFSILIFWDGHFQMPVEKGLLGFLASLAVLILLLFFQWPNLSG